MVCDVSYDPQAFRELSKDIATWILIIEPKCRNANWKAVTRFQNFEEFK